MIHSFLLTYIEDLYYHSKIEVRLNCDVFRQWYPEGCSETRTIVAVSHHSQINEFQKN